MASTLALALGIAVVVVGTPATVAMAAGRPAPVAADDVEDRVRAPVESRTSSFKVVFRPQEFFVRVAAMT
ncbi:MAG TPA: hypothetical protein VE198_09195 [Actinoallomurus sp.]|jgi:hypothetical protein|nr:hypothetical protein [Actinoallomurus sp.]